MALIVAPVSLCHNGSNDNVHRFPAIALAHLADPGSEACQDRMSRAVRGMVGRA
jgi:hypothetical protein